MSVKRTRSVSQCPLWFIIFFSFFHRTFDTTIIFSSNINETNNFNILTVNNQARCINSGGFNLSTDKL